MKDNTSDINGNSNGSGVHAVSSLTLTMRTNNTENKCVYDTDKPQDKTTTRMVTSLVTSNREKDKDLLDNSATGMDLPFLLTTMGKK